MCLRFSGDNWPGSINFKSDQVHQNPWNSIKHGSTGSLKKVPKRASIECRAQPPVPQVMKVCFILVLGHKYGTCALVFYRGCAVLRTSCPKCTHAHYSIEKMVSKIPVHLNAREVVLRGWPVPQDLYLYKWGGHQCRSEFTGGYFYIEMWAERNIQNKDPHSSFGCMLQMSVSEIWTNKIF